MKALLLLEDGFSMTGKSFTGPGEALGEVVFSTGMVGYQEMITDPSYSGQILTFTYPLIGNYGICPRDNEAAAPHPPAVLMKECCKKPSNRQARESLQSFLARHEIMGIEEIDTRTLTLHLRRQGTMRGVVSTNLDSSELKRKLSLYKGIVGRNLAQEVTTSHPYTWSLKEDKPGPLYHVGTQNDGLHVVVIDLGVKYSILRALAERGCRVTVVPAKTCAGEIKALEPNGILLSNGPGDPAPLDHLLPTVKKIAGWRPLMGICMGHQVLGRLMGIDTFKLTFGHRGINHPVKNLQDGKVFITTQNHGFCLSQEKPFPGNTQITQISLFDGTVEGMENRDWQFFSVQYHPEASPGPHDTRYLFDKFCHSMLNA